MLRTEGDEPTGARRLFRRVGRLRILGGCVAFLVVGSVFGSSWAGRVDRGYVFSRLVLHEREGTPDDPRGRPDFTVGYATAWTGSEFPGWRACVVRVLAEDGSLVAEKTIRMFDVTRQPSTRSTEVEVLPGAEGRDGARVEAECAGPRLDDPNGRYEVSDVRIERDPIASGDRRTFALVFDDTWIGAGIPGVQTCAARVYDASGTALFDHRFNFTDGMGSTNDAQVRIITADPVEADPATAELACGPLSP